MDSIVDSLQYIVKENPHENYLDDINPDEDEGNEDVDDEKNGDDEARADKKVFSLVVVFFLGGNIKTI